MSAFVPKKVKKQQNFPLGVNRNLIEVPGDIGIEIEVEGRRIPGCAFSADCLPQAWCYHQDGSLRGDENGEFVLRNPIYFDEVEPALKGLWDCFKKCKTEFDDSNRTSVHVHLNVQQFFPSRLISLMALYIIFEEILTNWCGDHRVGNLFCLRAKDAPAIITSIKDNVENGFVGELADGLHYAGMNMQAMAKYGSLEFRPMRGTDNMQTILLWCKVLQRLYEISEGFKDPREIIWLFSSEGPTNFISTILGDYELPIVDGISLTEEEMKTSVYEGIRLAQDICYSMDWDNIENVVLKKDPFGRPRKKIAQALAQVNPAAEIALVPVSQTLEPYVHPGPPSPTHSPDGFEPGMWFQDDVEDLGDVE